MIINKETVSSHLADIIVLLGNDRLSIEEKIRAITEEGGQDAFSELNINRIDGSVLNFNEISLQLNMLPLGGRKRIVILDSALEIIKKKGAQDWLQEILSNFSPTTILVLILDDEKIFQKSKMVWNVVGDEHWLRKMIKHFSGDAYWIEFSLPSNQKMPDWIMKEAEKQGGSFNLRAAVELSRLVGNDLFQAKKEIEKAILYVGDDKKVSADVVRLLCASSKEESVFALVDAIGQRNGKLALNLLRELNIEMPIQYTFSMLVRQIRLLILAKEALMEGGGEKSVMAACRLRHTFIAKKLISQT
ncbi:MAG: DNA polymerase III subunit delta, partial [Anaerolineaceae bacterium]|nr:DNA polymerase III subunit delta [Anaerolineaceae bacterium]